MLDLLMFLLDFSFIYYSDLVHILFFDLTIFLDLSTFNM